MLETNDILWQASRDRIEQSHMKKFIDFVSLKLNRKMIDWQDLYNWSIGDIEQFWSYCSEYTKIKWHIPPQTIYSKTQNSRMFEGRWFSDGLLNFAENLLPHPDSKVILTSIMEGTDNKSLTGLQLWNAVALCQKALLQHGIKKGDRVAGVIANCSEAIIAMLATTSLGAIWSSCSPDFGVQGVVDRLGQIEPKVIFVSTGYSYNGKYLSCVENIRQCKKQIESVEAVIGIDHLRKESHTVDLWTNWEHFLQQDVLLEDSILPIDFVATSFDHPVYIMYSSGTTGVPKCIVHGAGGTLLQHKKELLLHTDVQVDDKLLYFTTCGWMMWNWMVSTLSTGASLVVFDGSPSYPDLHRLWRIITSEKISIFGTSPKFIQACMNAQLDVQQLCNTKYLRTILSTGSPLLPEHFTWIYRHVKNDVHLASISGGTDIISCFLLGNPLLPVRMGEIQAPGLGMAVESWDEHGHAVRGQKAELVCTKPFVSMPVGFWNDEYNKKYSAAYFEHYTHCEVWWHGDFIELTQHGAVIHGRSDATLNPGGVRIGTAEIYRQVENIDEIEDSIAVGIQVNGDTEIALFVKLKSHVNWEENLKQKIKLQIKANLTPRHIPFLIQQVTEIPYTRSGKKVELAVTKAFHGQKIDNLGALSNPQAIQIFEKLGVEFYQGKE